jgi:hypothetical protein
VIQPLRNAGLASEGASGPSVSDVRFQVSSGQPPAGGGAGHYGFRIALLAALFSVHVLIILQIADLRGPVPSTVASDRMSLTWVTVQPHVVEPTAASPASAAPTANFKRHPPARDFAPTQLPEIKGEPPSGAVDWKAEAERAVAAIAADETDTRRSFGSREQQNPSQRGPKPFGWDRSQTERVQALPGGTVIRLNDHCSLVLMPLPLVGCAVGKIEARGDLFDDMDRPATLGDWKDDRPP